MIQLHERMIEEINEQLKADGCSIILHDGITGTKLSNGIYLFADLDEINSLIADLKHIRKTFEEKTGVYL